MIRTPAKAHTKRRGRHAHRASASARDRRSRQAPRRRSRVASIAIPFLLALIGFATYGNSLDGQFLYDDNLLITNNTFLRSWSAIKDICVEPIGEGTGVTSVYYRPVQILTYLVIYQGWGERVEPYHLVNVMLHVGTAILVFTAARILTARFDVALLTALLWIVHPVHAECVSYVSGTGDCLLGFFGMSATVAYLKYLNPAVRQRPVVDQEPVEIGSHETQETAVRRLDSQGGVSYLFLFLLAYSLALLSKETALAVPIALLAYHLVFRLPLRSASWIATAALTGCFAVWRFSLLEAPANSTSSSTALERLPGSFAGFLAYVRALVAPYGLHMGHEARLFEWTDPRALSGACLALGIGVLAYRVGRRPLRSRDSVAFPPTAVILYAIAWFLIFLLPASSIVFPVSHYMADRNLYLPSVGFALSLAIFLEMLGRRSFSLRAAAWAAVACIAIVLAVLTVRQNRYWNDPMTFYHRTLRYAPNSVRMLSNIGNEYARTGDANTALEYLGNAVRLDPEATEAHYNMAVVYNSMGKNDEAMWHARAAIAADPRFSHAYNILGVIHSERGEVEQAMKAYNDALRIVPRDATALTNMASLRFNLGEVPAAFELMERAVSANPRDADAVWKLGYMHRLRGDLARAILVYEEGVAERIADVRVYAGLGELYAETGQAERARTAFEAALRIDGANRDARAGLARLASTSPPGPR